MKKVAKKSPNISIHKYVIYMSPFLISYFIHVSVYKNKNTYELFAYSFGISLLKFPWII